LAHRFKRIFELEFVGPAPRAWLRELVGILNDHQVRDVERNESERLVAVEELIAAARDEVQVGRMFCMSGGEPAPDKTEECNAKLHR
jgi:hypothetical protein